MTLEYTTATGPDTTAGPAQTATTAPTSTMTNATTSSSGAGTTATPGGGATPASSTAVSGGIDPKEIKNAMWSIGMGAPDQLEIFDYQDFGHYAAAYVMAADENVYLVLFNDETGGWAILATYTGLPYEKVKADLQAKGAPDDLIQWADPGDG